MIRYSFTTANESVVKIIEYRDVPLSQIDIGLSQARTRDVEKNLDDLARSINTVGLLEPIVLAPMDDDRYEVITGQRRYLAVDRLGWSSISAGILDHRPDGDVSKAISLTENMVREDMATRDYIDACTTLFHRYNSIKAVSEELGLPYNKVSKYVKFDQLIPSLQERVRQEDLTMDAALRAQKAATNEEGEIEEETALAFADEMNNMSGLQRTQLEKAAEKNPNASAEEIIEVGRRQPREARLTVVLSVELRDALDRYANDEGTSRPEAAADILENRLIADGYAKDED